MDIGHVTTYEMAGIVINHLYLNIEASGYDLENPPIVPEMDDFSWVENGVLHKFNQWELNPDGVETDAANLAEFGWVYYP